MMHKKQKTTPTATVSSTLYIKNSIQAIASTCKY